MSLPLGSGIGGSVSRPLRGGPFETYADHRMAHAAVILGLRVPGVQVVDVATTSKTFTDFPGAWTALVGG